MCCWCSRTRSAPGSGSLSRGSACRCCEGNTCEWPGQSRTSWRPEGSTTKAAARDTVGGLTMRSLLKDLHVLGSALDPTGEVVAGSLEAAA